MQIPKIDFDVSTQLRINPFDFNDILCASSNDILHFLYSFLHSISQVLSICCQILRGVLQRYHPMVFVFCRLVGTAHT